MNATAVLTRKIAHPWRWMLLFILVIGALIFIPYFQHKKTIGGPWGPIDTRLEKVLWTSGPEYQIFYGPGTPQSLFLAHKLIQEGYLNKDFKVPDVPIYVAYPTAASKGVLSGDPSMTFARPTPTAKGGSSDDPAVIYNFNLDMAKRLREAHRNKTKP